jgi:hypothetical protein
MQPKLALALLLALAIALAGCIGQSSNPSEPTQPTSTGGAGAGNNTTRANATVTVGQGNASGPQKVHDEGYQWLVNPPPDAKFDLDHAASLAMNVTQDGPGAGTFSVELLDPQGTSAGKADINAAGPASGTPVIVNGKGAAGSWTLKFSGNGIGGVHVTIVAT